LDDRQVTDLVDDKERRAAEPADAFRERANHPQRVIRPNPFLKVYVAERAATNRIVCKRRSKNPSLKRPVGPVAPE
jgi:hypothetical protein